MAKKKGEVAQQPAEVTPSIRSTVPTGNQGQRRGPRASITFFPARRDSADGPVH